MLEGVETMFANMPAMLKKLKKESYAANTEQFVVDNIRYFNEISTLLNEAEDKRMQADEIADAFVNKVVAAYVNKKNIVPAAQQANLSIFMVYYVFPTILKTGNPEAKTLADALCRAWHKEFKENKISYTDYNTLYNSFREKIFGIF